MSRLTKHQRSGLLRNVWLFEQCTNREIAELDQATTEVEVPEGRILARQGDRGAEFVVIVDGKAEVTRDRTVIAMLGPGDFFGEMSLLDNQPRAATVKTTEPTRLLVMTIVAFKYVLSTMPSVDRKMLTVMAQRLRDIEQRYVPLAEHKSSAQIA